MEFLAPGFSLDQPLLLWAFTGSESVDRRFIYENQSGSPTGWQSPKHVYSARTILVLRATNQGLHNIISVQVSLSFCSMIHSMNLSNSEQLSFCYQTALELYSRQKERKTFRKDWFCTFQLNLTVFWLWLLVMPLWIFMCPNFDFQLHLFGPCCSLPSSKVFARLYHPVLHPRKIRALHWDENSHRIAFTREGLRSSYLGVMLCIEESHYSPIKWQVSC